MATRITSHRAVLVVSLAVTAWSLLAASPGAFAKAKTPRCKSGQLLVRLGKKAVCKRTAAVFPTPQAGDSRVAFVKFALAPATSKVPGKRGKRVRTFSSFGKPAKKARATILRLLPKLLAKVDAARPARAAASSHRPIARAADCLPPGTKSPTYTSKDGNSTMTASMNADGMSIGFDGTTSAGISIHFIYATDAGCNPMKVPDCPQASGEVDAQSAKLDDVIVEVMQHGKVLSYTHITGKRTTKATGQNAVDAKLDWVRIDDDLSSSVTVQGKNFPKTTFAGSFHRTAVWDMRSDSWQQDKFVVKIIGQIQIEEDAAAFGSLVREVRASFRKAQDEGSASSPVGWSKPASGCVTIDWSPASDSLKVKKGNSGSVKGTLSAKTGGIPADGDTKVVGQSNGSFNPTDATGATPTFSYAVTADSGTLSVSVEATSPAGAGSGEWHQPIQKSDSPDRISGTFSGEDHNVNPTSGADVLKAWSGTAVWKRAPNLDEGNTSRRYYLESASVTVEISGFDGICSIAGSHTFNIPAQPTLPSFTILNPAADVVFGTPDKDWVLPFTYSWSVYPTPGDTGFTATLSGCAHPYEGSNGMTVPESIPFLQAALETTTDGVTFAGSESPPNGSDTWSFAGSG